MALDAQLKIGAALGIDLAGDTEAVAAAKIMDAVGVSVLDHGPRPSTVRQTEFGRSLGLKLAAVSLRIASAEIQDELRARNDEAVRRLKLERDAPVVIESRVMFDGRTEVLRELGLVSSVKDGIVYLRGGNGRCAPASRVRRPTRQELRALKEGRRFVISRRQPLGNT